MTRIDERGPEIRLDAAAVDRLRRALDRDGVAAAYLFGSQAAGGAGPLSDVDVAVWASPGLEAEQRFRLRLALIGAASSALATDEVDLIVLDDAPALLRHAAWREGRLLIDRDPRARVRGETWALVEYLDTKPLRATLAEGRRRRLAEGRFGRR